ncbi:MAG: hypothetical protein ABFD90_08410 [Phycisphaerales bacterium]
MIAQTFEDLSQALRVLAEVRIGANALFTVDFDEAVGNIENGLTGVLNAFHSLYDAMKRSKRTGLDWYKSAELCTMLALRNARHHNLCHKVRTLFRYHLDTVTPPTRRHKYLFVDFAPGEADVSTFDVPLSLSDLQELLLLPQDHSRLGKGTHGLISKYIDMDSCIAHAADHGLLATQVFFNVVPLIVNAGIALHPHIRNDIVCKSTESGHFNFHFREVLPATTTKHEYQVFDFWRP